MVKYSFQSFIKFTVLISALLIITKVISQQQSLTVELPELHSYSCHVKQALGDDTFQIYTPTNWQATQLADELCSHTLSNTAYKNVSISWQPRDSLTPQDLIFNKFDLIWHRKTALRGLFPNWEEYYQDVLSLPNYSVHLYARSTLTDFSPGIFANKRIGLIDDKSSYSGYLILMETLMKQGVSLDDQQVVQYTNRQQMINDFLNQKIDFIPASEFHPELSHWPKNQTIPLATDVSMGQWFMPKNIDRQVNCKVKRALTLYQAKLYVISQSSAPSITCEV